VAHDLTDEDGPIWLTMRRIKRGEPPEIPDDVVNWLNVSPDPDKEPTLLETITRIVSESEKDNLLATGQARVEDCTEATGLKSKGGFDVTLRLEDRPEVTTAAQRYISTDWLSWAEAERPKRRSIALYQKLFEVAQLTELAGAEQPIELVWGIGLARWITDGYEVDLPLLERLVEIEINQEAGGEIRVRPRSALALLQRLRADHPYGDRCYRLGGCAGILYLLAAHIDARQFNPAFPATFPRCVQSAIWRYCAENGLDICNGNRIADDARCDNRYCQLFRRCDRIALRAERLKHEKIALNQ
jgi:hypothetical protein